MKLNLDPVGSLENQTSAVQVLNENFEKIAAALENTVSRDGAAPNFLKAPLDVNSQRIINVAAPQAATDVARWSDITTSYVLQGLVVPNIAPNAGKLLSTDGSTLLWRAPSNIPGLGDMKGANNLSEVVNPGAARASLGLGTMATEAVSAFGKLADNTTKTGSFTVQGRLRLQGTPDHVLDGTSTTLSDRSIGWRGIPFTTTDSNYTFTLQDAACGKLHTSAAANTYTLPNNSVVAYPVGTVLVVYVIGTGAVTIARGPGVTIRKIGSPTDANVTVSQWGRLALLKLSSDTWVCEGINVV